MHSPFSIGLSDMGVFGCDIDDSNSLFYLLFLFSLVAFSPMKYDLLDMQFRSYFIDDYVGRRLSRNCVCNQGNTCTCPMLCSQLVILIQFSISCWSVERCLSLRYCIRPLIMTYLYLFLFSWNYWPPNI